MNEQEKAIYAELREMDLEDVRAMSKTNLVERWEEVLQREGISWTSNPNTKRTHAQRLADHIMKDLINQAEEEGRFIRAGMFKEIWAAILNELEGDFGYRLHEAIVLSQYETDLRDGSRRPSVDTSTPLKYHGGKQKIARKIVARMPPHARYIEPFAGGLAVLFSKPRPDVAIRTDRYVEIVNDLDEEVMNFWTVLREDRSRLEWQLYMTPYSQAEYEAAFVDQSGLSDLERARRFFIRCYMGFRGSRRQRERFANPNNGAHPVVSYRHNIGRLQDACARLEHVVLACEDALRLIARHNKPDTLIYCDPPYPNTEQDTYDGYSLDDLQALVDLLADHKGPWMLSNYEQPTIQFPSGVRKYHINKRERLWVMQRTGTLPSKIQKRFDRGDYDIFQG